MQSAFSEWTESGRICGKKLTIGRKLVGESNFCEVFYEASDKEMCCALDIHRFEFINILSNMATYTSWS